MTRSLLPVGWSPPRVSQISFIDNFRRWTLRTSISPQWNTRRPFADDTPLLGEAVLEYSCYMHHTTCVHCELLS